jgi:hypothetical protein
MARTTTPRWKDGRLDPDWLGSAGLGFVRTWLLGRLAGNDPYQPLDARTGEDPDAFVVGLLREVGAHHPAFDVIARAMLQLLDEAAEAPAVPPYLGSLLRICQQVRLPQASTWFAEKLGALARDVGKQNRREERWGGYETAKEIAYAAVVQSPGLAGAASRPAWERLLEVPRYTTIAFLALSRTFPDQARHLGQWWRTCNADERDRELEQLLDSALRDEGEARVRALLREHASSLPPELKHAVDATLRRLGGSEVFVPSRTKGRNYTSAIDGAGLQRKYVLAEQRDAAE